LPEADQPQWSSYRKRALAGERLTVEYNREQKGVSSLWEVSHNPIRVGESILGVSTYARDITERKRAEEGRFIRKIAEASPHVMFVFNMPERRIVYTNRQITGTLGYTPKEVEDMRSGVYPRLLHEDDLRRLPELLQQWGQMADGQIAEAEYRMKATRGGWRWFMGRFTVFSRTPDGKVLEIIGVAQDITEHKRSEKELRDALSEKEALLKEVHHRVKNNLQIITSLMNLQAASLAGDPAGSVFDETKHRVRSMALLHETLYRSADLARIDLPVYVESLCSHLARSYGVDRSRVEMAIQVERLPLDLDRALPCGLMINELVSNSFKYAFPDGRNGRVAVALRQETDKMYVLTVSDDGVGLPPDWDVRQSSSLGLRLVSDLTQQLRGTLRVEREGGCRFTISFPPGETAQHP
jgi:PAS domain S-box-containing protein